ncbi:MAG: T9SS type A sorting domain-containing protein [candidate division Zixibacteria bacterium]|nr:T9SS type A sorting domain-containing protein [Candidatus Tariuqbacter arcticus]
MRIVLISAVLLAAGCFAFAQEFTFTCEDTSQPGALEETNHFYAELTNVSSAENIIQLDLDILNLPDGWIHSWCVGDLCLPPFLFTFNDTLAPGQLDTITIYITPYSSEPEGAVSVSAFSLQNPAVVQEITFTVYMENSVEWSEGGFLPQGFVIHKAYPNPFNPNTKISFTIVRAGMLDASVYNILGVEICRLFAGSIAPGFHQLNWNGKNGSGIVLPAGAYFVSLRLDNETRTIPVMKLK